MRSVNYGYDGAGRVSGVTGYASGVTYHPHGVISSLTFGNGVTETAVYNNRLQPYSLEAVKSGNSLWKQENFYCSSEAGSCSNNNGNVISQKLTAPKASGSLVLATAYGYDAVNRITSAAETGAGTPWSQTFGYGNQFGNLTQSGDGPPSGLNCASYDGTTNRCNASGFGYDPAGDMTGYGDRVLGYDAENRQIHLYDGIYWDYFYDGEGRRVKKTGNGTTTVYVYDAQGRLASEYESTPLGNQPDCVTCYLTADHLGSTRLVTDGVTGEVKRRYDYHPFGWEINPGYGDRNSVTGYTTTDWSNPKFTGHPRDYESGLNLDYFGARYFSAAQGRFTSPDPLMASAHASDPQSWNRYAYARNNPLRYLDPDGLEVPEECVNDKNCTIVVKVNAIYDKNANNGKGLTPEQKKKFEQGQIAKAKKDYATSNIQLDVSYTEGGYTTGPNGTQVTGAKLDALNIMVSTQTPSGAAGDSGVYRKTDLAVTDINIDAAHNGAFWPFWTNTTSHELAHQFLGDPYRTFDPFEYTFYREPLVDAKVGEQSLGTSQPRFREGIEPRRYAVPLNPEANKPRQ